LNGSIKIAFKAQQIKSER